MIFLYPTISFLLLWYAIKNYSKFEFCIPIIFVLCFLSFFCPILYYHPQFQYSDRAGIVTLEPILFWFVNFFILLYPLYNVRLVGCKVQGIDINLFKKLSYLFFIISTLVSFVLLPHVFENFSIINFEDIKSSYQHGETRWTNSWFLTKVLVLHVYCKSIIPFFFFYSLAYVKGCNSEKKLLFFSATVPVIIGTFAKGVRADMAFMMIQFIVLYFLFKNKINNKVKIYFKWTFLVVGGIMASIIVAFSFFRFSSGNWELDPMFYLYSYCAESLTNFNGILYDNVNIYTEGNYSFPLIRMYIGLDYIDSAFDFKDVYMYVLSFKSVLFYTFIGELYRDFGFGGTLLCSLFISLLFRFIIPKNIGYASIWKLFVLFFYMDFIASGLFYNKYDSYQGNLALQNTFVVLLLILLYLHISSKNETV